MIDDETFERLKKKFIERCESHASDPMTTPTAAAIYTGYADIVRVNGCLPDHKDSWATDAFAFVFGQVCRGYGSIDTYQYHFEKMFPDS